MENKLIDWHLQILLPDCVRKGHLWLQNLAEMD